MVVPHTTLRPCKGLITTIAVVCAHVVDVI